MVWQENKLVNLRLAAERLDGLLFHPGETMSYWRLIGKPSRRKGYREGQLLREESLLSNDAIMMYSPLLPGGEKDCQKQ